MEWRDVHLDAAIPYLDLRPEVSKVGRLDMIPLHPYVVSLLRERSPEEPDPSDRVHRTVPDMKTVRSDFGRAGIAAEVPSADGRRRRRADFHALRHAFSTHVAEAHASDVVREMLCRHRATTVNGGYTHARMATMYEALVRLPSPLAPSGWWGGTACAPGGPADADFGPPLVELSAALIARLYSNT